MMATPMQQKFGRDFYQGVLEWVKDNLEPYDVFTAEQLEEWAELSGYIHKED